MSWKTQMKRKDLGAMVGVLCMLTAGLAVSSPPNTVSLGGDSAALCLGWGGTGGQAAVGGDGKQDEAGNCFPLAFKARL